METNRLLKARRWEEEIQDVHFDKNLQTKQTQKKQQWELWEWTLLKSTSKMNVENVKFQNQGWKKSKAENESINDNPCLITQKENDKRRIQC
jgi:hypothetical protein